MDARERIEAAIKTSGLTGGEIASRALVAYATYLKWRRNPETVGQLEAARLYDAVGLALVVVEK